MIVYAVVDVGVLIIVTPTGWVGFKIGIIRASTPPEITIHGGEKCIRGGETAGSA